MPATIRVLTRLTDAQQMHRDYPDTFEAPTQHELNTIVPGDMIKVCQVTRGFGERFWVEVKGASGKHLIVMTEQGAYWKVEPRFAYTITKAAAAFAPEQKNGTPTQ